MYRCHVGSSNLSAYWFCAQANNDKETRKALTRGQFSKTNLTNNLWDRELWPTTLTFKLDLNNVKVSQHAKRLGQRLFTWKVIVQTDRQTDTHTHTRTHTHTHWCYHRHEDGWNYYTSKDLNRWVLSNTEDLSWLTSYDYSEHRHGSDAHCVCLDKPRTFTHMACNMVCSQALAIEANSAWPSSTGTCNQYWQ